VYAAGDPTAWASRAGAVLAVADREAVICGVTGLRLAGVDLPPRLARDPRVWVQVPGRRTTPSHPEVRLVRSSPARTPIAIGGLSVAPLPDCWLHLAPDASIDELVEWADAMTRRQHPVTTKAALAKAVAASGRRRGIAAARAAVELCVARTDSMPETDLRLLLVRAGLPPPRVNLGIADPAGRIVFHLDLAYETAKVAIEYDGAYHVGDRARMEYDAARRRTLEDQGWRIITVTWADLTTDPHGIVASVRAALAR